MSKFNCDECKDRGKIELLYSTVLCDCVKRDVHAWQEDVTVRGGCRPAPDPFDTPPDDFDCSVWLMAEDPGISGD